MYIDIAEFYPSITEELLDKAICWARTITPITDQQEKIIKHARTSFLFSNNDTWIKQNSKSLFDVMMCSYDGAEICDLAGLYILNVLTNEFGKERVGLYRDDGLVLIKGKSGRIADKVRKKLHTLFEHFNLKITAQVNHQSVNFLDVTFNLTEERYQPYRKPNNEPIYIDSRSNHPPAIIRQLQIYPLISKPSIHQHQPTRMHYVAVIMILIYNTMPRIQVKLTTPTLRVGRPANRNAKDTETYYGLTHLTAKT